MDQYLPITDVYAREILDSRGNPTVEVEVLAGEQFHGRASVQFLRYLPVHQRENMRQSSCGTDREDIRDLELRKLWSMSMTESPVK